LSADKSVVCVTGAGGYIGSHVVKALLDRGYAVRATLRERSERKSGHLERMQKEGAALELHVAELLDAKAFDAPLEGALAVVHTASPVRMAAKHPEREIVDPAVRGTSHVVRAAIRAKVKTIVYTSSISAILSHDGRTRAYDESDWCEDAKLDSNPYGLSKVLAERAAVELVSKVPEAERPRLVRLHPSFVFGPLLAGIHARTSPAVIREILASRIPGCPRCFFNLVDVRDVAHAHVEAIERTNAEGRFLLTHEGFWWSELAERLRPHYPERKIRSNTLPNALVYLAAALDSRVSIGYLRETLGFRPRFASTRAKDMLGLNYRPVKETLLDTARSILELGMPEV
jgi:nucleoside-diphosphate-sugar epimerase